MHKGARKETPSGIMNGMTSAGLSAEQISVKTQLS